RLRIGTDLRGNNCTAMSRGHDRCLRICRLSFVVNARRGVGAGLVLLLIGITQRTALADPLSHHTVSAHERTSDTVAEVVIRDDDLVGQRIVKATYQLYDGYEKAVLIPHGGSALKAVDIANCHRAGMSHSPPWPCSPALHASEVIYGDTGGHRFG